MDCYAVVLCISNIDVCSKAGLIRCSFLKESERLALLQLQNDGVKWTMFRGLAHIWQEVRRQNMYYVGVKQENYLAIVDIIGLLTIVNKDHLRGCLNVGHDCSVFTFTQHVRPF